MKRFRLALIPAIVAAVVTVVPRAAHAQSTTGLIAFEAKCASCHQTAAGAAAHAPDAAKLRRMSAEAVDAALGKAPHTQIAGLADEDRKLISAYLGGRKIGIAELADAKAMPNRCATNPPMGDISKAAAWTGWGNDPESNARFQPAGNAQLTAADVPKLKLKWAFGFVGADEAWSQPAIAGGRMFVGSDAGTVYSLDAATGCIYWSFQAEGGMRDVIDIAPGNGASRYAIYFGDMRANMYSLDAETGKLLWKTRIDDHPLAQVTGSPTLYEDRLYVPLSSSEERGGGLSVTYPCCSFRGSVVALDAKNGKQVWKTYVIPDAPKPAGKSPKGIQHYAPAGGAVWAAPTIDTKLHALYIGTGDSYIEPAGKSTDAVMALDMNTGKALWSVQDTADDVWLAACGTGNTRNPAGISENCPMPLGPDYDFGSSPILKTLPDGHRLLIAAQKSGMVWAHDPDKKGALVWKAQLVDPLGLGMITFGGAADDQNAYFGLRSGGIAALDLKTGNKKWFTPLPGQQQAAPGQFAGQTAALTEIPGVVFSGGWDGVLRSFSTKDGMPLWQFDTAHEFQTVNGVAAKGGSMGSAGATIANGMLFIGSGYVFGGGTPGNLLLAFSPR
jgi:polyvinyl alcohol dehydrogenase (cytochrome)